jgi:hypothetical protein
MPRSDPNQSVAIACKHLFRNLRNAKALQRNPLVAHFFDQADGPSASAHAINEIWRSIRAVAQGFSRNAGELSTRALRHRIIIERCELEGEAPGIVAAGLGLSIRQLYRERRLARINVAVLLASPRKSANISALVEQGDCALAQADLLADFGRLQDAQSILTAATANATDAEYRCSAFCTLAELSGADGAYLAANDYVRRATSDLNEQRSVLSRDVALRIQTRLNATRGVLFLARGISKPVSLLSPSPDDMRRLTLAEDSRWLDLAFRLFTWRMYAHEQAAKIGLARESLALAGDALDRMHSPTPLQTIDLAVAEANAHLIGLKKLTKADHDRLSSSLLIARRLGLLRRATKVLIKMFDVAEVKSRARQHLDQAMASAVAHGSRRLMAQVTLRETLADLCSGNLLQALQKLPTSEFQPGDPDWRFAKIVESRAALALGDRSTAEAAISEAYTGASDSPCYKGIVLLQQARLYQLRGKLSNARETIAASIDLLAPRGREGEIRAAKSLKKQIEQAYAQAI